jgi:hypothetical protein
MGLESLFAIFPGVETPGWALDVPAGLILYFCFPFQSEFPEQFMEYIGKLWENYGFLL